MLLSFLFLSNFVITENSDKDSDGVIIEDDNYFVDNHYAKNLSFLRRSINTAQGFNDDSNPRL